MGAARKFIDLAFDLLVFILGLAVLMGGMRRIGLMQDEELERTLNGGGRLAYVSGTVAECSGGEVVALLLGHDHVPVELEGVTYQPQERDAAMERVDCGASYGVERRYRAGEYGSPERLVIIKR